MDELAYATRHGPGPLRLKNYTERDENENKAFSTKELRACYQPARSASAGRGARRSRARCARAAS